MSSFEKYTLIIQGVAAIGTLIVAMLAIWGDAIRSALAAPQLRIRLRNPTGEPTKLIDETPARYYHLVVNNFRSWAPAKNVIVYLTQVEQPAPDGSWQPTMLTGPVPLVWQFGHFSAGLPSIGPERICDLFRVTAVKGIELQTQYQPNSLEISWRTSCKLRAHVIAFADNAQSEQLKIEIAWDGRWDDGASEMAKHLIVKEA